MPTCGLYTGQRAALEATQNEVCVGWFIDDRLLLMSLSQGVTQGPGGAGPSFINIHKHIDPPNVQEAFQWQHEALDLCLDVRKTDF